jgi:aerobic C4-dicarboxylate transport protein
MTAIAVSELSVSPSARIPLYRLLYVQVLVAIALGALAGALFPDFASGEWVKALGDGFVKLIKMAIAPIIFCTIVSGIAHIEDAKKVGRVGVKALIYFEVVSTFALMLGLLVGNLIQPGAGFSGKGDAGQVAKYAGAAHRSGADFLLDVIPDSAVGAFAKGDILQLLLFSILFGFALMAAGERSRGLRAFIDDAGHAMFGVIAIVM